MNLLLHREAIVHALRRLGELALAEAVEIRLIAVGGTAMILGFGARLSTKHVDALVLEPADVSRVRSGAQQVAREEQWPDDCLNDAAKDPLRNRGLYAPPDFLTFV